MSDQHHWASKADLSIYGQLLVWAFWPSPVRLVWGVFATIAVALLTCYLFAAKGLTVFSLALQLAGILTTFSQVLDQRKALEIKSLPELYATWWSTRPTRKPHTGSIVAADLTGSFSIDPVKLEVVRSGSIEEQVNQIWSRLESMSEKLASVETKVFDHQREARQALEILGSQLDKQIGKLNNKVEKAIGAGPFTVLFGLWMVLLSTILQVGTTLCAG